MKNTLRCQYTVSSYDVDSNRTARLTSIANFLQETAYRHAGELELGYHHLAEKNLAWILSRMRIRMVRYPKWDDLITVETWPHGIDKLFALRDFRIYDQGGEVLGVAMTCWLMADINTHRPVRIDPDFIKIETREDSVFEKTIEKIELPQDLRRLRQRDVSYSDLDVVNHVNNVKYIEWCLDTFQQDQLLADKVSDITMNYVGEARAGEKVEIYECEGNHAALFSIKNLSTGKECVRASIQI